MAGVRAQETYRNPQATVDARVADVLSRMTLEEKASLLAGAGWMETAAIERLGIPAVKMADGPMGVRNWTGPSAVTNAPGQRQRIYSTSFPAGIALAATWDEALAEREGRAIGMDTRAHGRDMILGPTVNINRVPVWGRNFEGFGEDPFLSGRMAVGYIHGVQAEGVLPSLKHFAANNEEFERHRIDSIVDERTLNEIYLPAFEAAVKDGGVWTVMSAYNLLNGVHCGEDELLLTEILRKRWGFKGLVVSDWASTYSTAPTVKAGMDVEMPGGAVFETFKKNPNAAVAGNDGGWLEATKVLAAVKAGELSEAEVTANAGHILHAIFASGLYDRANGPGKDAAAGEESGAEQVAVARQVATESIVLLKNDGGLLPLDGAKVKRIAVIGPNAVVARTGGGGSSLVLAAKPVSPLEGIRARAGAGVTVASEVGVTMEGEDPAQEGSSARARLIAEAVAAAKAVDVAIVVVGRYPKLEGEGHDIATMDLPAGQDELIEAVEAANPRTVVVLNTGAAVTMTRWLEKTPALLDMWYGGQEGGNALAAVLFGDANPSGRLPVTLPKLLADSPAYATYPGVNLKANYAEGIYVGYRYFDTKKVEPAFPFGYGLSYTSFRLSGLVVKPTADGGATVSVAVTNTGSRAGAAVVETYVHDGHAPVDRPERELKSFRRVELKAGETQTASMRLDRRAFEYWSVDRHDWTLAAGEFRVDVGMSSRDLPLSATVTVGE